MTTGTLKAAYSDLFAGLIGIRKSIFVALAIFLAGVALGVIYKEIFQETLRSFSTMARSFTKHSGLSLILMIFLRNSFSAGMSIALGFFLGIFPALGALANGLIVGLIFTHIDASERLAALLLLIPHGIFELPAMFISWGLGIWKGVHPFTSTGQPSQEKPVRPWKVYFFIVIPLLVIAAAIEGTMMGIMKGR